ncbi:MAG: heavy metal translocating P-type ATPase [Tepidisphaeraceae bacterium]
MESALLNKHRIDLSLLVPERPGGCEGCAQRLETLIGRARGIGRAHVVEKNGHPPELCLHYDPRVVTLAQVERLAKAAGAKVSGRIGHLVVALRAVEDEDGARRIERELMHIGGVLFAVVNVAAQRARVEFDQQRISPAGVQRAIRNLGYAPFTRLTVSALPEAPERPLAIDRYRENRELIWSIACGLLLVTAWVLHRFTPTPVAVILAVYAASYTLGGLDLVRRTIGALRSGTFAFDIDLLMLLAAVGAATLGRFAEGAFLLFLFSLANALEHYALGRARNAIRALADLAPATARVVHGGRAVQVPVEQVAVGEAVLVKPAERIPVDGTVFSGRSAVDQAPITGESTPIDKSPGDEVFAGTVNGQGALEITTTRAVGDRTLDRVVRLVEEAQTQKAPTQRFAERFARVYVPCVLIADVLVIVLPPLFGWWNWHTSFYRGMALLVGASPCALALGTPAVMLAGIAQAARKGVLLKGGVHLENLGIIRAIAMDKTGTLTIGRPEVTDVVAHSGATTDELLRVAAAVERKSQHPLAKAVVRHADAAKLPAAESGELQSITGAGVRSEVDGKNVEIGSLRMWETNGAITDELRAAAATLQADGKSVMSVRHGDRWLGVIGLADRPRPRVRETLARLRRLGLSPLVMVSGDNEGVARAIAREVGVDEVHANLLPEQKVQVIRDLVRKYKKVAMVGDGVNDAPALANATIGIAMGGAGTAAALETADAALMGDDLAKLPFAVALSRKARVIIAENLIIALGVMALLILATTFGALTIGPAVFFHEGSTVVVIFNALRLLGFRERSA